MPDAPVTPEVVEWAIDESGMSVENIASRLAVTTSDISAWITGTARPSKGQLTKLAETLRRPRVMFFLPEPPSKSSLPDALRRPAGERAKERAELTFDERLWVRRARRLQEFLTTLSERAPNIPSVLQDKGNEGQAAKLLRDWTGVTWEFQRGWRSAHAAFGGWREALENNGVAVLAVSMGKEGVRGFSLKSDHSPMIAVNTADIDEARCFTLCHELAHLALGGESSCADSNTGGTERWCDGVASQMLIPRPRLRSQIAATDLEDLALVQHVADHFKVSRLAAAVALEDIEEVDGAYARTKAKWPQVDREKEDRPARGRPSPQVRVAEYGGLTVQTIIEALQSDRINELDASDYLRLDRTLLPATSEYLNR